MYKYSGLKSSQFVLFTVTNLLTASRPDSITRLMQLKIYSREMSTLRTLLSGVIAHSIPLLCVNSGDICFISVILLVTV